VPMQRLTFLFWHQKAITVPEVKQIMEDGETKLVTQLSPAIASYPYEFTVNLDDIKVAKPAGGAVGPGHDWHAYVGKSVVLLPPDTSLDPVYEAALAPDTLIVRLNAPIKDITRAPYPDGTLSASEPSPIDADSPVNETPTPADSGSADLGSITPEQLAEALNAIQPELVKLKIKTPPAPLSNPFLQQALPGHVFFVLPSTDDGNTTDSDDAPRRFRRIVVKKPDGSAATLGEDDGDDSIFKLLKDQFTALTEADARKYIRTHLLLIEARVPRYTYGPINKITVNSTAGGGLTASGEAPITGGGNASRRPAALTLTVNFDSDGMLTGGKRGTRAQP
jgi:hypothetical protein